MSGREWAQEVCATSIHTPLTSWAPGYPPNAIPGVCGAQERQPFSQEHPTALLQVDR